MLAAVFVVMAVAGLSYVLLQKSKDSGELSEKNTVELVSPAVGPNNSLEPSSDKVMDAESIELARGAAWDIPGDAPQDVEQTRKELEQKVEELKQATAPAVQNKEAVAAEPPSESPLVVEEVEVVAPPPKPSMTFRVDVKGAEYVEALYLVSKTTKKKYQRPFRSLPTGQYILYYRWKGHADTLKDPKPLVLTEGAASPSIACKPGFEVCRIQ